MGGRALTMRNRSTSELLNELFEPYKTSLPTWEASASDTRVVQIIRVRWELSSMTD
jgi:hypothetical protein